MKNTKQLACASYFLVTILFASFVSCQQQQEQCLNNILVEGSDLQCGESLPKLESHQRIIGGSDAYPGQFPFLAAIRIKPFGDAFQCGGAIIDDRHILTAAHCFDSTDPRLYSIAIGAYKRQSHAKDCRIEMNVEKVWIHELYDQTKNEELAAFDIALVRTAKPINFKLTANGFGSVNRICLPEANKEYKLGQEVTLAGWGHLGQHYFRNKNGQCDRKTDANSKPIELQTTNFRLVPRDTCVTKLRKIHVCLNVNAAHTQAAGDSGSPYVEFIGNRAVQLGIVSGQDGDPKSKNCERITAHAIKVATFIDWINQKRSLPSSTRLTNTIGDSANDFAEEEPLLPEETMELDEANSF